MQPRSDIIFATVSADTVEFPRTIFTAVQTEDGGVGTGVGAGVTGAGVDGTGMVEFVDAVVDEIGMVEFVDAVVVTLVVTDTVLVGITAVCVICA